MNLGLSRNEVRIVNHDVEWGKEFLKVKREIYVNTSLEDDRIEHIGSTAILGMPAKPIIDILVGVDDLDLVDRSLFKSLDTIGFKRLQVERPVEIVLAKFKDSTFKVKTHFIHLVNFKEKLWNDFIFFRDYLNTHELARAEYLRVKKEYLSRNDKSIYDYTDYKESFVKEILERNNR